MYDIKQLKQMIVDGKTAVSKNLEERIMNDQLSVADHEFLSKSFKSVRELKRHGFDGCEEFVEGE